MNCPTCQKHECPTGWKLCLFCSATRRKEKGPSFRGMLLAAVARIAGLTSWVRVASDPRQGVAKTTTKVGAHTVTF